MSDLRRGEVRVDAPIAGKCSYSRLLPMITILARAFPAPSNWQDFERLCFDLFSRLWKTNDAEMHGRTGQPQAGVDIYGHDRVEGTFAAVQCKGKDQGYNSPLTIKELRDEVEKAKTFKPRLDVFVLATTAPNDVAIQEAARELTEQHKEKGLFEVRVQGWATLKQRITDYPELVQKYFPDLAPIDVLGRIDESTSVSKSEGDETRTVVRQGNAAVLAAIEKLTPTDELQTRIAALAKLIEQGSPGAAVRALEALLVEVPDASARNLYRIHGNMAFAYLVLGDEPKGIAAFRAAYAADPGWAGAKAALANAELLEGNKERAFELAKEALAAEPAAHHAAAPLIEGAPANLTISEIEDLLPKSVQERFDVSILLANRARASGDQITRKRFVDRAVKAAPNDWRVLGAQAEVLLEPIFALEGLALTHAVPADRVADLERAISLLQQAWSKLLDRESSRVGVSVGANLLSALEAAGREQESEQLLAQALKIAPTYQPFLRRYAQQMVAAHDWQAAAEALDAIPPESIEPPDRLFKLQALIHTGKSEAALTQAKALEEEFGTGRGAELAAGVQIEAAVAAGHADTMLAPILERWPKSIVLRSMAHNCLAEGDARRTQLLDQITELAKAINDPGDRMHAAEALFTAKQYSRAADMYGGLYAPDADSMPLLRALQSLLLAERRREARELFDSLSENLKTNPKYVDIGVSIYEYSGLLKDARAITERAFATDDTLRRRIHWLSLLERLGDSAAIIAWLNTVREDCAGVPRDLIRLALAIDRHLGDPKCFPIAYRALRAGYSDPQVHFGYMVGLFFMGSTARQGINAPTEVGPNTAVVLWQKDGPRKLARVLETAPDPHRERGEIAPNEDLAPRLLGRKVGDEVEVASAGVEPTIFVIKEIRNKYVHAHFRSLEDFEKLFPGHQALGSFNLDESKSGEERFKPLLESVKRRGEFALRLSEAYRQGQLPLMLMSKLAGVSPCDVWESIVRMRDLKLIVSVGPVEEFAAATADLERGPSRVVVDPITLYGLCQTGIAPLVRRCFDDMAVVQTTIDLFGRLLDERRSERGTRRGTLGWDGERYRMAEVDDAAIEQQIEAAERALEFAKSLTLVPAEPTAGLQAEARQLFAENDPSFLDTIYAAQGGGLLLLSDELLFRRLSQEAGAVKAIWTQPAAAFAANRKRITNDEYNEIVSGLVSARYHFTTIGPPNVIYQLRRDNWAITPRVEAFAANLAEPTNEPGSVMRVFADLVQASSQLAPGKAEQVNFLAALLRAFKRSRPDLDLSVLNQRVMSIIHTRMCNKLDDIFNRHRLLDGTSLVPPRLEFGARNGHAARFLAPLAEALNQALSEVSKPLPEAA
jgi:cellulose synthase operon protein C